MLHRIALVGAFMSLTSGWAVAQDPQRILDGLLLRQQQLAPLSQHNQLLRLELQRIELERRLFYATQSDAALMRMIRDAPEGSSLPAELLLEASRRGLITLDIAPPTTTCENLSLGGGDSITNCYDR